MKKFITMLTAALMLIATHAVSGEFLFKDMAGQGAETVRLQGEMGVGKFLGYMVSALSG